MNSPTQALPPKSSDHDDQRLRCHWLLLALVALHVVVPLLGNLGTTGGRGALLVSYLVVLMAAVRSLAMRRRQVRIACLLAIPIVGVAVALLVAGNDLRDVLLGAVSVPFIMFTGACVLEYVLKGSRLTEDRLFGAAAVFLLAVHAWGGVYAMIELVSPGSFTQGPGASQILWGDLVYFSAVTMTTLGYGDITPVTRVARSFASLEAITGLFYMAIIVARFVGRFEMHSTDD